MMSFEEIQLCAEERKKVREANVEKSIRYFQDRNKRSWSNGSVFTRRRNLACHLGLDKTTDTEEVQKINTYSLPVPSSALNIPGGSGAAAG